MFKAIVVRYPVRETLKSQLAILSILLLIFFCQKLVRILDVAVDDDVPANPVLLLLGLGIPEMAQFILPLGLFLGLLMTLSKLYIENEVTVMHTCGLSKAVLVRAAIVLALLTGIITAANVMWAGPWSSRHQDKVLVEVKADPGMAVLAQGQFQQAINGNSTLFVGSVDGSNFKDVFLAQVRPKGDARPSVIITDSGHLTQLHDGSRVVTLNQGTHFEGIAPLRDFRITGFQDYQAAIGHQAAVLNPNDTDQMNMCALWTTDASRARTELTWCIMLVFTVSMMVLMVIPLSVASPRQGCVLLILPAMLLYLLFFLVQTSLKSNGGKGRLDPVSQIWTVNLACLALAIVLNLWDMAPMHRLCTRFMRKGAV